MLNEKFLFEDPPEDKEYPFTQEFLTIPSQDCNLLGLLELTTGKGPHPTVLMLHGFPGNEKNMDIVQSLKRAGFNVLKFHYKGSWGSPGNFSFLSCLEDTKNAIKFLLNPSNAEKYRIDTSKVVVVGHSMGGYMGIMALPDFPTVKYMVAISPLNLCTWGKEIPDDHDGQIAYSKKFKEDVLPLRGTTPQFLTYELLENKSKWDYVNVVKGYQNKRLHLIAAKHDDVVTIPENHQPLVDLNVDYIDALTMDTTHSYSNSRVALIRNIFSWLKTQIQSQ